MASLTDPARELADIVDRLSVAGKATKPSQVVLGEAAGFAPWSTGFYRLNLCILDRAELVQEVVRASSMDPDHAKKALEDIDAFKNAFKPNALRVASTDASSAISMIRDHGKAFRYLSHTVRPFISYPSLSDEEIEELLSLIDQYMNWLLELEKAEYEFGRAAIIQALNTFKFRLEHIGWLGSEFTLDSIRAVIAAYEEVKRNLPSTGNGMAEKMLKDLGGIIHWVSEKVGEAKEAADKAGFVWESYKTVAAIGVPLLEARQLLLGGS